MYTVTNTNDSGANSLRQAILDANASVGVADTINFNIAGTGIHTITLSSALTISDAVTIDATTDDSFAVNGNRPAIVLDGTSAGGGSNGLTISAGNTTVTGLVINRFGGAGIYLTGAGGNVIQGNYIGTDASGTAILANGGQGIYIGSSSGNNTIGGTSAAAGNLISGNNSANAITSAGIYVLSSGNNIQGNRIGTDIGGTANLANNGAGITLSVGTVNNLIGGTSVGAGNIIGFNSGDGVRLTGSNPAPAGSGNAILGNQIFSNAGDGIDLKNDGVTLNDAGDADTGPNDLQNFPVLTSANSNAAGTTILGSINSNANTTLRIEFFANRPSVADAPNGEGERYLGFVTVTTDGSGNATINTTVANVWVNAGDKVSATATVDLGGGTYGSTSEFAANVTATSTGIVVVDTTSDVSDGTTTSITNLVPICINTKTYLDLLTAQG